MSQVGVKSTTTVSLTTTKNDDALNRLPSIASVGTSFTPSVTSHAYTHDDASRLTGVSSPAGAFTYTYDPINNLQVRKLALPNGGYITNGFDALGRMTSTTLKNSAHAVLNAHAYLYDDASRRTRQTRTGGDYADYGYDKIGQLKSALGMESGGTTNRWHERFFYGYDPAGNLSNRVQNVQTNVFHVDSLNQLTSVVRTNTSATVAGTTTSSATNVTVAANGGAATAAIRFADATFARTNVTLVNGTNTFVAVAGDSLGRWDTNTVNVYLPTAVTFLYDQNGNLRTNGTRIFEYDDENQLTRITEPSAWKSEFTYDGKLKMRISRDYAWQGSAWVQTNETRRVYDGMLVLQERNGLNVPRLTYTRGKDLSGSIEGAGGIGGLLALSNHQYPIADNCYFHSDGNGNVTCLVDTNQAVVARYLDDPFGNTLSATGPKAALNKYRFSSKELHGSSGMVYYGYRWYIPERQRWLNKDPISEKGGVNLFRFNSNVPVNRLDKWGLAEIDGIPGFPPDIKIPGIKDALKDALKFGGCLRLITCTACGLGLLGIEAICIGWESQGYNNFNECVCENVSDNAVLRGTCGGCFAPLSLFADVLRPLLGCTKE